MAFGFPAHHTEDYSAGGSANLRVAVKAALRDMRWRVKEEYPDAIIATTNMSFFSWGEFVTIDFLANRTLSIESKCVLPALYDWGVNKSNVNKFLAALEDCLENPAESW
jgi:hypothetical protein